MKKIYHIFMALNIIAMIYLSILAEITGEHFNAVFGGLAGAFLTFLWIIGTKVKYARN